MARVHLRSDERGQGLVEYALIISVVSLGTIAALVFLRGEIRDLFTKAGSSIQQGAGAPGGPIVTGGSPVITLGTSGLPTNGTTATSATFTFTSSPAGTGYTCVVSGPGGSTVPCTAGTPFTFTGLQTGSHTLTVTPTPAGTAATHTWTQGAATSPPVPGTVSQISCTNTTNVGPTTFCQEPGSASVTPGTWTGNPTPTISYQWAWNTSGSATCDTSTAGWTNVGTNSATLTSLPDIPNNAFDTIRVIVTGTNTDPGSPVSVVRCTVFTD